MAINVPARIRALRVALRQHEVTATQLEQEVVQLKQTRAELKRHWKQIVQPQVNRLEAARAAVRDMEHELTSRTLTMERRWAHTENSSYVPIEEQYHRIWSGDLNTATFTQNVTMIDTGADSETTRQLRRVYHELGRRYHPDFGADQGDRDARTDLMAEINIAYNAEDLETLETLLKLRDTTSIAKPKALLEMRNLETQLEKADQRVEWLTNERAELLDNEWIKLSIDIRFAKRQGRDLLSEICDDINEEYHRQVMRLAELQRMARE